MRNKLLVFALAMATVIAGCSKNPSEVEDPTMPTEGVVEVTSDITTNTTWSADKIYVLKGNIFVTGQNTTLKIEAGTIIKGDKATKGALIISRNANIEAIGTPEKPIVFTSSQAAGARAPGDWGGVIILGNGIANNGTASVVEGIPSSIGDKALYGGNDNADNSGTLKYVRIEFAGIPLLPDVEINGLTMAGVGSGTTIDYIQVYRSGDDAFEWFGGAVKATHLLAIGSWDDDFDTDNGFSGKVQFALAQRAQVVADFSGSNGFESDNNAAGTAVTPVTSPVFSNVTIVGPMLDANLSSNPQTTKDINANFQHGVQIRRNSSLSLFNSIIANYTEGIFIDDALGNSSANYTSGSLVVKNNLFYGDNVKSNEIKASSPTAKLLFEAGLRADNSFVPASSVSTLLVDPLKYGADFKASNKPEYGKPNFLLKAGSAAETGAVFTGEAKLAGFEVVNYRGAFGTMDWSAGWSNFDPQSLPYTTPGTVN